MHMNLYNLAVSRSSSLPAVSPSDSLCLALPRTLEILISFTDDNANTYHKYIQHLYIPCFYILHI